jgi:hypothetical protein
MQRLKEDVLNFEYTLIFRWVDKLVSLAMCARVRGITTEILLMTLCFL